MRLMLLAFVVACGGHSATKTSDASGDALVLGDGSDFCPRVPGPADAPRHVIVSHPYDDAGSGAPVFEVLDLDASGTLARASTPRLFQLGERANFGTVEMTPDGKVGVVALDNGTVGAFTLAADGTATPTELAFKPSFYAEKLVMSPAGDRVWALDTDTKGNHGGVYELGINCDGTLVEHGLVVAGDVPRALLLAGTHAVIASRSVYDQAPGAKDVHLVDLAGSASLADADAFPGTGSDGLDSAIVGGAGLTSDGATVLIGDTAAADLSSTPNRVAVVSVGASTLTPVTVLSPLEDPESIMTSPFGNVAVASSAFGNALFIIDQANGTWRIRGQVAYQGGTKPQLPGDMVEIQRGMLQGHVFVSENVAIRQLVFHSDGSVEDLGTLAFGDGLSAINGVIGATP